MTVPIENRSVALGTCRLAHSLFSAFSQIASERLVRSEWERHLSVRRPREDDGASWESVGGTWHMPIAIGTILIFSLYTNNVRTAGPIAMGEELIDVFPPREDDGASWESIVGPWHVLIAIGTILMFSPFANSVRTAGSIGMGEALIDVIRPREYDGAHWESIGGTWRLAHFIFSLFANTVWKAGPIGLGETIIDVLRHREYVCACWQAIGGTWHMPIAIGTILIFSPFANNVRTAGPIATWRGTDRCVSTSGRWWCLLGIDRWHLAHADWHNPHF